MTTTQGQAEDRAPLGTAGTGEPMELQEEGTENIEFPQHSKADGEEEAVSATGKSEVEGANGTIATAEGQGPRTGRSLLITEFSEPELKDLAVEYVGNLLKPIENEKNE